jgi:hypothetical protein
MNGRLIKNLFDGCLNKGEFQIQWDVNVDAVTCGVYFLKVTGEGFSRSRQIIVVK